MLITRASILSDHYSVTEWNSAKFSGISYSSPHEAEQVRKQEEEEFTSPRENDGNRVLALRAVPSRDIELQFHTGRFFPSFRITKSVIITIDMNFEASREKLHLLTATLKSPVINSSQWNEDAAGSILNKKKKLWISGIREAQCSSNPNLPSDSPVGYGDPEEDFISSGMNDQELLNLNSCPGEHFPVTRTFMCFCTLEEFGATGGLFHAFHRSKYSLIEDASLVLNGQMADVCAIEFCSDSSSLSDSIALDDDLEFDLISSETSEEDLQDLKLLPDGLLPEIWVTSSFSTREKSETVTIRGVPIPTFDGSMFTPIEEASLILSVPIANTCASLADLESEITSENIDLFQSLQSWDNTENLSTEMLQIWDRNVDPMPVLQLHPTQNCDPRTEDVNSSSEGTTSDNHKCTLEESSSGNSCFEYSSLESLQIGLIQDNLGACLGEMFYLSKHQECDSIASCDLMVELEDSEFRKISNEMSMHFIENEANELSNKPVASATQQPNPLTSVSFKHMVRWDRDSKLQCHERGLPSSRKRKNDIVARRVNCEAYRSSLCFAGNSKLIKGKASNKPLKHSSNRKMGAIKSVLDKKKNHQIKQIDEEDCHSNPSSLCNSSVQDDDFECAIINSEMSEKELLDLNLLPDGLLPENWVTTSSTPSSTPKKNRTDTIGGFHVFDGSRYNPIEEASLILNRPITCLHVDIGDKEEKITSEEIDLFKNLQVKEVSGNVSRGMQNTSNENSTLKKSFNSDSCFRSNSFESLPIQNNRGACPGRTHCLSQPQACDSIVSTDLTPNFQEQDFGKRAIEINLSSFEDEANKIVDDSTTQPCHYLCCESLVNMVQCDHKGGRNSILSFEQSLVQLDELIDCSNQEPLSRSFTPDCLLNDEKNMESSPYKMDSDYEYADPARDCKGKYQKGRLSGSRKTKTAMLAREVNSEGYRFKLPCLAEKSKPVQIKASKIPLTNLSQSKRNAAGSLTSKTMQKRVKEISKVGFCSSPSSVTDSAVIDDDPERDLIEFEISEQELSDLNLLPNGLLPEKQISSPASTTKKSESDTTGVFHSFDGSRFSPIEEASLVLNIPITDVFVRVADKETDTSSENIELFKHLGSWKMSENIFAEMFQLQDDIVDPMLELQLHPTQFCDLLLEDQPIALTKQPSQCLNLGSSGQMVYCDYNEQRKSIFSLDYNSQNVRSLAEVENLGRERKIETFKAELLEVKNQIKELEILLKCTLRRTDIMQQKFAKCKVVMAW
ncbi:uncharacterized protein LOC131069444 [Cryptomeria japonica]|uniref:uncharacterized protein LOC131069444 n=1 Tax=Cryptomeria japonica TaxID=3369 RepID=UPI0027DA2072|nr:uncharacterized protein LOC131069444 [Cryptomeria japonica]XP_057860859.2 uncharacterized protein LOC131069444 [Cryptomeria japonica]XP_057860865.2 uncharacterized protein LOC131069444 [Cryptomeria japonica]XP_059063073.1 uncharacterized protein LOC131069444 [Cryptomeria japonica]